jgi:hypothetical protein
MNRTTVAVETTEVLGAVALATTTSTILFVLERARAQPATGDTVRRLSGKYADEVKPEGITNVTARIFKHIYTTYRKEGELCFTAGKRAPLVYISLY